MALVVLSKVEQRLDAVRAVLAGAQVSEVAESVGVSRQSVHGWLVRYLLEGVAGLADRSHRPHSCPHAQPRCGCYKAFVDAATNGRIPASKGSSERTTHLR